MSQSKKSKHSHRVKKTKLKRDWPCKRTEQEQQEPVMWRCDEVHRNGDAGGERAMGWLVD